MRLAELQEDLGNLHSLNAGGLLDLLKQEVGIGGKLEPVSNKMYTSLVGPNSQIIAIKAPDGLASVRSVINKRKDIAGFCMYLDNEPVILATTPLRQYHSKQYPVAMFSDELHTTLGKPSNHVSLAYNFEKFPKVVPPLIYSKTSASVGEYPYNKGKRYAGSTTQIEILRKLCNSMVAYAKANGLSITAKLFTYDEKAIEKHIARDAVKRAESFKERDTPATISSQLRSLGQGKISKTAIIKRLLNIVKQDDYKLPDAVKLLDQLDSLKIKWPELKIIRAAIEKRLTSQ